MGAACTPRVLLTWTPRAASSGRHSVSTATAELCSHAARRRASSSGFRNQVYATSQTASARARSSGVVA